MRLRSYKGEKLGDEECEEVVSNGTLREGIFGLWL